MQLNKTWRKGRRSAESANCVEARLVGDLIEVRNSNDPTGPSVLFSREEWRAFTGSVVDGDFALPAA